VLAGNKAKLKIHLDSMTMRRLSSASGIPGGSLPGIVERLAGLRWNSHIQQPLIAPLYHERNAHELLAILLGEPTDRAWKWSATTGVAKIFRVILSSPGERL